ncbi:MAG: PIN domain nuclease, partial [Betaproteobacteria bacterium]|nr:PIN domain nuclease [Betaproteobacteria bacterium]
NILVAALISPTGPPAAILQAFLDERITLVTCEPQLEEFRRVTRDPELRKHRRTRIVTARRFGTLLRN